MELPLTRKESMPVAGNAVATPLPARRTNPTGGFRGRLRYICAPILWFAFAFLPACSTPASRIKENQALYSALSPSAQAKVAAGTIAEGMTRNAVFIAWGSPDDIYRGSRKGVARESWIYQDSTTASIPGYTTQYRRGPRGEIVTDTVYEPIYVPQPYISKVAEFENDRVVSWENRVQPSPPLFY